MGNARNKKIAFLLFLSIPVSIAVTFAVAMFPVVRFNDNAIRMFTLDRLDFSGRGFDGRVFGTHVLETEHGEITLKNFARVFSRSNTVVMIYPENFMNARASHDLIIEGIKIPQNIEVVINPYTQQIFRLDFARQGLARYFQEIIISGVPLSAGRLSKGQARGAADIVIGFLGSGYVVLADTTQIHFALSPFTGERFGRGLYMYNAEERWVITGQASVKRPWETEFTEYRSITFGANWGAFIDGVPFE